MFGTVLFRGRFRRICVPQLDLTPVRLLCILLCFRTISAVPILGDSAESLPNTTRLSSGAGIGLALAACGVILVAVVAIALVCVRHRNQEQAKVSSGSTPITSPPGYVSPVYVPSHQPPPGLQSPVTSVPPTNTAPGGIPVFPTMAQTPNSQPVEANSFSPLNPPPHPPVEQVGISPPQPSPDPSGTVVETPNRQPAEENRFSPLNPTPHPPVQQVGVSPLQPSPDLTGTNVYGSVAVDPNAYTLRQPGSVLPSPSENPSTTPARVAQDPLSASNVVYGSLAQDSSLYRMKTAIRE